MGAAENIDIERVQSLRRLGVIDTPSEERFDRITRLASALFKVPVALVSLVDCERQWFKSRVGTDMRKTPRTVAFCSKVVEEGRMLVVEDAHADPRFTGNPLVTSESFVRFYAGHPVRALDGHAVACLCIIDQVARAFSETERDQLRDLAILVEDELNKMALVDARAAAERALYALNAQLEQKVAERTSSLNEAEARVRAIIESSSSAFVAVDEQGRIHDWNSAAERSFGWKKHEVIGTKLASTLIPERFRAAHAHGMARFLKTGAGTVINQRVELPALRRDGQEIMVEMTISALPRSDGVVFGAFLHDISDQIEAKRALEEKQKLLDAVVEAIDIGVVACSADGAITMFNRAMREIHGCPGESSEPSEWTRKFDLYAADGKTRLELHQIPLYRALNGESVEDTALVVAPPGAMPRSFLVTARALVNTAGERVGAVAAMKEVSELAASQRKLQMNEQRLLSITENVAAAIGQVDKDGNFAFLNSHAARLYGKRASELLGKPAEAAHAPEDLKKVGPYIAAAMSGKQVTFEDSTTLEGRHRFFQATYIPNFDAEGAPNGFFAMGFDITARKNSEISQRESEERLRTITNNLPVTIAYIDRSLTYRFANAQYKEWYGVAPEQMIGHTIVQVFGQEFMDEREQIIARCFAGETVQLDTELRNGRSVRVVHSVFIPHKRGREVVGAYVLSDDVTAVRRQEVLLRQLAHTDSLTGLANRRSYEMELAAAINRSSRQQRPLALAYLDIDHFKSINDTIGHANGDAVLKEFGRRLVAAVRKTDTVSRLAGDEFTIILENIHSFEECELVGQKIIDAMALPFEIGPHLWPVQASVGIAWCGHGEPIAKLMSLEADAALYKAKEAGRNCCVVLGKG